MCVIIESRISEKKQRLGQPEMEEVETVFFIKGETDHQPRLDA